jgi:6-phosphofructokinase 1
VQRDGFPGAFDRFLATRVGAAPTKYLSRIEYVIVVGLKRGEIGASPLSEVVSQRKTPDVGLVKLAQILAR